MCVGVVMGLTATAKGTMTGIRTRVIDFILKQDARNFVLRVAVWVVCVVGAYVHVRVEAAGLDGELEVSYPPVSKPSIQELSVFLPGNWVCIPLFSIFASPLTLPHILTA